MCWHRRILKGGRHEIEVLTPVGQPWLVLPLHLSLGLGMVSIDHTVRCLDIEMGLVGERCIEKSEYQRGNKHKQTKARENWVSLSE